MSNLSTFKPEFSDVIRSIIDTVMMDVNVCLPGKIAKYDSSTQYADVQIQLYTKLINGSLKKYPVIPNVPVKHPRAMGGKAFIHMPLAVGDDVLLVFSQRSIDSWKSHGGINDPADPRKHHITDAYALVGGSAIPDAFKPSTSNAIEIQNGSAQFQAFPGGQFKVKNSSSGKELIERLDQHLQDLEAALVMTAFGPSPFTQATIQTFETVRQDLRTLEVL